jgi:aspartyl-tRNA(Asn)/glutamyl-tRNA(Gln) amidotransferase subunit C
MIDRKDVEHVARLARLALTEAELERMRIELGAILQYVEKLKAVDVEGVEPTSHAVPLLNVMREDEVEPSLDREAMMGNAPDRAGEFFRVPRIIED